MQRVQTLNPWSKKSAKKSAKTESVELKPPMQWRSDILSLSTTLFPKFGLLSQPFVQMWGPEVDFADLFYREIATGVRKQPHCGFHFFTPFPSICTSYFMVI